MQTEEQNSEKPISKIDDWVNLYVLYVCGASVWNDFKWNYDVTWESHLPR